MARAMSYSHDELRLLARCEQLRQLHNDRLVAFGSEALVGEEADKLDAELCRLEEQRRMSISM